MNADNFDAAASALLEKLSAARAARAPVTPTPVFTLRSADDAEDLSGFRFLFNGVRAHVVEADGDLRLVSVNGQEQLMNVADLLPLTSLSTINALHALRSASPVVSRDVPPIYFLRGKSGVVCVFRGRLCASYKKNGGTVTHYAPVTDSEAVRLLSGSAKLYYVKGKNSYSVR